ncbi:DNA alkylation repair protein [Gordonia sp. PP30]|uniref:DNA alkylation repair protein n=1 Tax=Gordonia sp. PP30 TaxID=2935861 RepID=UPI001FFE6B2A|nr:DNA alkylation repair protein [Gordonia sp. PP30]UQE74470.1 DNA alkylation repair protein [Gordonia sp. PP30]
MTVALRPHVVASSATRAQDPRSRDRSRESADDLAAEIRALGDPERAAGQRRFFKTGPGEYGEGDVFAGVRVPVLRAYAKRLGALPFETVTALLDDEVHEVRQVGLFVATASAAKAEPAVRAHWVQLYRDAVRRGRVNNWDLVDCSADPLLGTWLVERGDHTELLDWAASADLWERRVGVIGTFAFIKSGAAQPILDVAPLVIDDRRDLIQKALGWMLRELGKRVDRRLLEDYLEAHAAYLGRTALSYATEHLTADQRAHYRSLRPPTR